MITVKVSKATLADPAKMRAVAKPLALAQVMAEAVRHRVEDEGQPATAPKPYATHVVRANQAGEGGRGRIVSRTATGGKTRAGYSISTQYAAKVGVGETRFASSADFHAKAGIKPGTYKATGEMWRGLQVRNFGAGAVIEFGGVSLGSSSKATVAWKRDEGTGKRTVRKNAKGVVVMRKPKNVRNWEKAGVVFKHSRVAVLQPTDQETQDMIDGLGAALFDAIRIVTTESVQDVVTVSGLARKFLEALER